MAFVAFVFEKRITNISLIIIINNKIVSIQLQYRFVINDRLSFQTKRITAYTQYYIYLITHNHIDVKRCL